jgi:hypothetical protein
VNTSTTSSADTTFLTCSPPLDYIQLADDLSNHVVCLVNDVVELDVCDGPHWSSDVLAIHPAHNTDDRFRAGEQADDICTVRGEIFAIDFDEAHVVRPRFQTQ